MTFEEWQATKRRVAPPTLIDRGRIWYPCAEGTEEVWLYAGNLVIEIRPGGRFMLQLPGEEEVGEELEPLERRLYEFARDEGVIA